MSDTPRSDAIALRLQGRTDLFCDDDSLAQYNDLLRLARAMERELAAESVYAMELQDAARWLVKQLDECQPHITSAFYMAYNVRGGSYTGPQYGKALDALRAALAKNPNRVKDSPQDGICGAHSPGSTTTRPDGGATSPEETCKGEGRQLSPDPIPGSAVTEHVPPNE